MFHKLAGIDAARRIVPALALARHNDNRPDPGRAAALSQPARPQRLAYHWRSAATGGLECYWQMEPADKTEAPGRTFIIRTAASVIRQAAANAPVRGQADGTA